jgi:4-amino-4-deoxy-L-arabinose transferase-like glycosyltransferase
VVALALRVALIAVPSHFTPRFDADDFETHAASIATGHGYPPTGIASPGTPSAFRPPAYPYLLGGAYAITGVHPNVGRLLSAGLGVVTVLLIAYLGAALWDRRIGLVAGAVAAVCPSLITLSGTLLSESLFLPLELGVALCVLALLRARKPIRVAVLLGVLCGVAALTRTVGILWLLPALIAAATARADRAARLKAALAVVASCMVVLAPWTIRNANALHAFVPLNTQGGFTLVGQYNPKSGHDDDFQAVARTPEQIPSLVRSLAPLYRRPGGINEARLDSTLTHDALAYIGQHPSQVPIAIGLDTLRMFNLGKNHQFTTSLAYTEMSLPPSLWNLTTITIQLITLIAALAIVARLTGRLRRRLGPFLVWAIPLLAIAATVPVVGTVRYRAPADPFLVLLAAVAIGELISNFANRRGLAIAGG